MFKPNNLVSYERSISENDIDDFNFIGSNPKGGFSSTVFGTEIGNWTVRGENVNTLM